MECQFPAVRLALPDTPARGRCERPPPELSAVASWGYTCARRPRLWECRSVSFGSGTVAPQRADRVIVGDTDSALALDQLLAASDVITFDKAVARRGPTT